MTRLEYINYLYEKYAIQEGYRKISDLLDIYLYNALSIENTALILQYRQEAGYTKPDPITLFEGMLVESKTQAQYLFLLRKYGLLIIDYRFYTEEDGLDNILEVGLNKIKGEKLCYKILTGI